MNNTNEADNTEIIDYSRDDLDDFRCDKCGNCHELCFCEEEE